jgi:hypothetical protein
MGFYITVEAEVDLEEYQDEINNIMLKNGKAKTLQAYIGELEKELHFYKEEYWRTPQRILEDLKSL